VAIDLPGHPDGTPLEDVGALADALVPGIEAVGGPRALVGHSLGGAAVLELALARPDLADGVVIIASGLRLLVRDSAMERARADFASERDRLLAGFFTDPATPLAERVREVLDACGPRTLLADYAACRSVDLRGRLGRLAVPALIVCGADDPLTPPRLSEELARELPMAHLVVIPQARHMPMAEWDGTVSLLIAAFLARLELTLEDG
jgi:pimeloyl-ACP methyl ester carboxylesterase